MKGSFPDMLLLWALQDLLRHPAKTLMNAAVLVLLTFLAGTALLAGQALDDSTQRLLARAPTLVVRRINPGGWMPIPIAQAITATQSVPGVINPRARIWGAAAGPNGPLTILAMDDKIRTYLLEQKIPLPKPGQAIVGSGISQSLPAPDKTIALSSAETMQLEIIARLPAATDMTSSDLVITTARDARYILSIPATMASDLALDVFHQDEAGVLIPELADAFPWPVRITSRDETQKYLSGTYTRKGTFTMLLLTPAILAMLLLVLASGHDVLTRRVEAGLLRTLGWTTPDLARLHLIRSSLICLPAITTGQAAAYAVVFTPAIKWVGHVLPGFPQAATSFHLTSIGAGLVLIELFAIIAIPYILASLWPVLVLTATDPLALLKGDFSD